MQFENNYPTIHLLIKYITIYYFIKKVKLLIVGELFGEYWIVEINVYSLYLELDFLDDHKLLR